VLCNKSGSLKVVTYNNPTVSNNYTEDCIKLIQKQALRSLLFSFFFGACVLMMLIRCLQLYFLSVCLL
jgi:hypothetical protein